MKLLHTSDWHLGQSFKSHSREFEHKQFLEFLLTTIDEQNIDILIVAGDIFDTSNPPNYALKMYHNFLAKIIKTACQDVVIVAGNHDSVSTLEVSKDLLKSLNIHVVASGEEKDEVIVEIKKDAKLKAIVCAVPFLRDRVLRDANTSKASQEIEDELRDGIKRYYKDVFNSAKSISKDVPIIASGHFTTTGASITSDSEREIYIGKMQNVDSEMLVDFDYVAMGHIHKPQQIGKNEHIRYSGSPIPLSFSETNNAKSVVIVEFEDGVKKIRTFEIPIFRELHRLKGDMQEIKDAIAQIANKENPPFVEVILVGNGVLNIDITDFIQSSTELGVELLIVKREYEIQNKVLEDEVDDAILSELTPLDIFEKRIALESDIYEDEELKKILIDRYNSILKECIDEDN